MMDPVKYTELLAIQAWRKRKHTKNCGCISSDADRCSSWTKNIDTGGVKACACSCHNLITE